MLHGFVSPALSTLQNLADSGLRHPHLRASRETADQHIPFFAIERELKNGQEEFIS